MYTAQRWYGLSVMALATFPGSTVVARTDAAGSSRLPMPEVRLPTIRGFAGDDAAYVQSIAERVTGLVRQAERLTDPHARASLLLAAANVILANELEPACTRVLLGLVAEPGSASPAAVAVATESAVDSVSRLGRADGLLAEAALLLKGGSEREGGSSDDALRATLRLLEELQAFAQALRVYLLPTDVPDADRQARRAASRLSGLLEERNPELAGAAKLWHAALRARESDPTRALSVLDLALSEVPEQGRRYAFYARLLRCRVVAREGGFATALALLAQVEKRCEVWFDDETERADALRAASLVSIRILIDWHEHLPPDTHAAERRWCMERAATQSEKRFGQGPRTVLRLASAIPILAQPPDVIRQEGQTSEPQGLKPPTGMDPPGGTDSPRGD